MPSFIAPIEHTRSFSLKPAEGLRYGNFEGVINLPPVIKTKKLGEHSFSTLNNQQIYKTICEWYEGWRAWQQKILLCGIVDRFVSSVLILDRQIVCFMLKYYRSPRSCKVMCAKAHTLTQKKENILDIECDFLGRC